MDDPLVVVGLPGIGLVGKLAASTIAKQLGLEKVADLFFGDFPPQAVVDADGGLEIPKAELWAKRMDEAPDVVVLTGDAQPTTPRGVFAFAASTCELLKRFKCSALVAGGAMVTGRVPEEPRVHVASTHPSLLERFTSLRSKRCQPMAGGVITGLNGVLPAWMGRVEGVPGACLLAEVVPGLEVDPRAAKAVLEAVKETFGHEFDHPDLDALVERVEESLKAMARASEATREKGDRRPDSYFG